MMNPASPIPDQSRQAMRGLAGLLDRITPWLVEVGSWVFGGLLALNLVVIAALITVGPADAAVLVGVVAFACALPLDVTGLLLLRLIKDVRDVPIDDLTLQAFREAQFPNIEAYFPARRDREAVNQRRSRVILGYTVVIGTLSSTLTLTGLTASLWHMARWVAELFIATTALSAVLLVASMAHSLPPESEAEKELKRRLETQEHG